MHDAERFTHSLLEWFQKYGRKLPWRGVTDPYKIWISEVMLQQTQVSRVAESFYPNFLKKFPTLEALAASSWEEVFPVWKGLGYYSRGKNMLRTAQMVQEKFRGEFPRDVKILQTLPGIGAYTARAILSFAWDERVPAIDTNIEKIIHVLWPREDVKKMAEKLISYAPGGRAWNGAMMDLSSTLREGKSISGDIETFFPPEKAKLFLSERKTEKKPHGSKAHRIEVGIACIHRDGKYLIQSRPEGKSFVGSWEFPGGKREKGEDLRACVKREVSEELGIEISVRPHFFEDLHHFGKVDLVLRFHRCQIQAGEPKALEKQKLQWASPEEFGTIDFLETNAGVLEKLKEMKF